MVVGSPMVALHVSTCDRNGLLAIEVQPEKVMDEVSACRPTSQSHCHHGTCIHRWGPAVLLSHAFVPWVLQLHQW